MDRIIHRFNSPEEFLHHIENIKEPIRNSDYSRSDGWVDTDSLSEAICKAKTGDPEVAKLISPKDVELASCGNASRTCFDVAGDYVDIGRYLTGEPECMGTTKKTGKPIINIMINASILSDISSESIQERGRAVLEIMSGLETNGYNVEITLVFSIENNMHTVYLKIKDSKDYFNLHSLAFWLTSSSVNRRLKFRLIEGCKGAKKITGGYGASSDLSKAELDSMPDCIYFPRLKDNNGGYKIAIAEVLENYKQQ